MILVTGATGLVGGNLIWHLLQTHPQIRAISRNHNHRDALKTIFGFYTQEVDQYLERIEWVKADIMDPESLNTAFRGVNTIFHCAAMVSLGNNSRTLIDNNVTGTRNVVHAALAQGVHAFCHVSSIAACGEEPDSIPVHENSSIPHQQLRSIYSQSKILSENEIWQGIAHGLPAVIVNPGVILGVSGLESGSSKLFNQVRKGMPFYTQGGSGYIDVQDVVKIMIQLVDKRITGQRYILVAGNHHNLEILRYIAMGFGKTPPFIELNKSILTPLAVICELTGKVFRFHPPLSRSMVQTLLGRKYYSSEKIKRELSYSFTPVEDSIAQLCTYIVHKQNTNKQSN